MKIGLTGSIGCGKSTVGQIFKQFGYQFIDSDEIVRDLINNDLTVKDKILNKFGDTVINQKNAIDRAKLATIVFNNNNKLQWLENLLHPIVQLKWQNVVTNQPFEHWIIEVPLLFEKKFEACFDLTVTITATTTTQFNRLIRKGLNKNEIKSRINNQLPINKKVKKSDYVISNNGSINFLHKQIELLCNYLNKKI